MRFIFFRPLTGVVIMLLSVPQLLFAQARTFPDFGPLNRPAVKLTGFFEPHPPETNVRPVLTIALPGHEARYTFLLTDMRLMAGPLRTPESILAEVKPYSTNFYIRASHADVKQLASATPAERVTIFAEYLSADRILLVHRVEKSEEPWEQ